MNTKFDRALLLVDQGRFDLAETELKGYLAEEPQHAFAHALLGWCLSQREAWKEATEEVQQAIGLEPDLAFAHYIHGHVLRSRNRLPEAVRAAEEAIRLDSAEPDHFWLLGALRADERQWVQALEAAEKGLEINAEHVDCTNLRALALVQLGRRGEAGLTLDEALARNPENAVTHANVGWKRLHEAKPREALESFREALRLDPTNEWARAGIVEALKARNPVYGLLLRYFLWMSRLSSGAQWGIVFAGYIGARMLTGFEQSNPDLAPYTLPLRVVYISFVFLTWTAQPLFNLLLRLDKFGRMALSEEQIRASNWIGAVVGLGLVALATCLVKGFEGPPMFGLMAAAGLVIPMAAMFNCPEGWPRRAMGVFTMLMIVCGLAMFGGSFIPKDSTGVLEVARALSVVLTMVFLVGAIAGPWVGNLLAASRPRK